MSDSDLTPLLTAHSSHDAGPRPGFGGTGQGAQYGQGTVLAWNPNTGDNQISYRGTVLTNVPMIGSTDILVTQPGDQVAVMSWAPRGGSAAYWIMGRLVIPGSAAAVRSIQFLQNELAAQIVDELVEQLLSTPAGGKLIRGLLGEGIFLDLVPAHEFTTSTSYTNLPTAGPVVADVEVSEAGAAIVFISARVRANQSGNGSTESFMSFDVSGATTLAAADTRARTTFVRLSNEPGAFITDIAADAATVVPLLDLNPGLHTFTAKYRAAASGDTGFANRSLMVIAL